MRGEQGDPGITLTIDAEGRVQLPASVRRMLQLSPGDRMAMDASAEAGVRLRPLKDSGRPDGDSAGEASLERVRQIDMFRNAGEDVLRGVARIARERRFERGEFIVREGEPCEAMYAVVSGMVKRFKESPGGREQVLKIMSPGDSFNEVPVLDGGLNPSSAQALQDSVLCCIYRADFLALLQTSPALCTGIIEVLGARLRHLVGLVEDLSLRRVTARVARLLLEHSEMAGSLTQQEMASMVGSVREVVARALRDLQEAGAIRMEGRHITVVDPEKLRDFQGD